MQSALLHIRKYLKWYVLLILFVCSLLLLYASFHEERGEVLKFDVLDIGQGDSLFIESPSGIQVLVDGGPNNNLSKEISKVMPFYDRHIDMIVVTNPDADHYEGFIKILDKYKVDTLLESGTNNSYPAYKFFEDKAKSKGLKRIIANRGEVIDLGGGVYLQILFPDRNVEGLSPNDGSIVMKLVYGETSVLLQGDSTSRIENYLLSLGTTTLKSTILKAGHHGSRTSSSLDYVRAVSPDTVVISSGKNNSYGHPHKEILEIMQSLSIPAYSTCNNGRLDFESNGKVFIFKNKNPKQVVTGCKI